MSSLVLISSRTASNRHSFNPAANAHSGVAVSGEDNRWGMNEACATVGAEDGAGDASRCFDTVADFAGDVVGDGGGCLDGCGEGAAKGGGYAGYGGLVGRRWGGMALRRWVGMGTWWGGVMRVVLLGVVVALYVEEVMVMVMMMMMMMMMMMEEGGRCLRCLSLYAKVGGYYNICRVQMDIKDAKG